MLQALNQRQREDILRLVRESDPKDRERLLVEVNAALRSSTAADPARYFPAHAQQRKGRVSDADITILLGGNRSGKSSLLKVMVCDIIRRRSVINRRLTLDTETRTYTRPVMRPLTIWIGVPTLEKARQDWVEPADPTESFRYMLGDAYKEHAEQPDIVYLSRYGDKVQFKSYEQGYIPFESSSVDVVGLDEEPPNRKIVNSCQMRLVTNNGVILMAFTPLEGLSWTYDDFYKPLVLQGAAVPESDRCWLYDRPGERSIRVVQMGMADNPRAADEARKMERDETMLPAEKNARLYGEYGYAEGVFFPRLAGFDLLRPSDEHAPYVLDELPRPAAWYLVSDPNHRTGSTLWMVDGDGNRIAVHEHLREAWVTHEHAAVFKAWLRRAPDARQWADFGAAGKYASNELNRDHGMKFRSIPKPDGSVSRTIKTVRGWTIPDPKHAHPVTLEMGAPRIYFYRPGLLQRFDRDGSVEDRSADRSELIEQLAQARQTDEENAAPDTPHKTQKHSLDLFDTARYVGEVSRAVAIPDDGEPAVRVHGRGSKFADRVPTPAEVRAGRRRGPSSPMALPFPSPYHDHGDGWTHSTPPGW